MHAMQLQLDGAQAAIREVRTVDTPAVRRLVDRATSLSDAVTRMVVAPLWS